VRNSDATHIPPFIAALTALTPVGIVPSDRPEIGQVRVNIVAAPPRGGHH
jgi:hypothetical protein